MHRGSVPTAKGEQLVVVEPMKGRTISCKTIERLFKVAVLGTTGHVRWIYEFLIIFTHNE
jgi:hypothetical protein